MQCSSCLLIHVATLLQNNEPPKSVSVEVSWGVRFDNNNDVERFMTNVADEVCFINAFVTCMYVQQNGDIQVSSFACAVLFAFFQGLAPHLHGRKAGQSCFPPLKGARRKRSDSETLFRPRGVRQHHKNSNTLVIHRVCLCGTRNHSCGESRKYPNESFRQRA
jgi:hypothetical protein